MAAHPKKIPYALDWQRKPLSTAEGHCAIKIFIEARQFFRGMEATRPRFASEAASNQLRKTITPIILNAIDGYLADRKILLNSGTTRAFQETIGVDSGYLNNAIAALSGNGLLDLVGDNKAEPADRPMMAGDRLIELLGENKASLLDHSRPLDVHRWSEHPEVNGFVDTIYSDHFGPKASRVKKKHLKLVLLDLYVAWSLDPAMKISVARDNNAYFPGTRYNELHITRKTIEVVDVLEESGLIRQTLGFFDHARQHGKQTRIWPSGKLIAMFEAAKFGLFDIGDNSEREVIILNDRDPDDMKTTIEIEYDDTHETDRMRKVVRDYNDLLRRTFIDIPTLKVGFIELDNDSNGRPQRLSVNQQDKFTRRIFNRGSFTKGGRFFGGWWQRCPKDRRESIFLDDKPVSELDYSGLHIVMLYANAGIDYWSEIGGDPYTLDPVPADLKGCEIRDLCKQLMLVAINARDDRQAFGAFRDNASAGSGEKSLSNVTLAWILDLLREKHKPIADKFASDAGIDLMNQDAKITEQIIEWFTYHEIPILSIHDSYLVQMGWEAELKKQMQLAFATVTGINKVELKEATHNPDLWEPLDEDDAVGFDFKTWEETRKWRFDPPRSKRYLYEREQFKRWLEEARKEPHEVL